MKKYLLTATVLASLIGSAAFSQTTVSSANIVGYVQTQTPPAGSFNIVSLVQFSDGSDSINIQDAIGNISNLNASATWANADKLITWNGGYVTYGLYQPASGDRYWMAAGAGWAFSQFAAPANAQLARGQGVWYQTGTGGTSTNMTISGDVFTDDTFEVNLVGTLTLLSYPYSSDINLTNLVVSNATASVTWSNADKIVVWNGGYVTYGLYQPASGTPYWMAAGAGWSFPQFASPTSATIALGKGFWYQSANGAKAIGFSKIYTLE